MSWGTELWDQYENISYHTNKGIDFLDKYGSFIKERCAIEIEYASKLRRLVKNHQYKKKEDNDIQYSYIRAFISMLQEISDLAGQHELIAENMCSEITNEINSLVKELKEERKKYLNEGQKLQCNLHQSYLMLDKSKKYYEKAFKEAERALEHYEKVDADLNLSRADVEKARLYSQAKNQYADQCKSDYATNLQKTNELQRTHFTEAMPRVFNHLQEMEKRRISNSQKFIYQSAKIQIDVFPIINKCLQGIVSASQLVDPESDCNLVIEKFKSGNEPPEDLPFEDLSNPSPDDQHSNHSNTSGANHLHYSNSISGKDTVKGTMVYAKLKKRAGIFGFFQSNKQSGDEFKEEIYADLPPVQRRKRILEKINSIKDQIRQETNVRDALFKMKSAYQENPALGDPNTIDSQLTDNNKKLDKLKAELKKFESYLNEIEIKKSNTTNRNGNGHDLTGNNNQHSNEPRNSTTSVTSTLSVNNGRKKRNSLSEESLSRSASDSSVSHNQTQSATNLPNTNGHDNSLQLSSNSNTPESSHNHHLSASNIKNNDNHFSSASSNTESINDRDERDACSLEKENGSSSHLEHNLSPVEYIDSEATEHGELSYEDAPIGKAKAIYDYTATNESMIDMVEGEWFLVIELDTGDGWTRLRRSNGEEGYVPTLYIEICLNE